MGVPTLYLDPRSYLLHEALDTATDIAILDQERAGVDMITDGEMRRFGAFFRTYYSRINGIQTSPPERRIGDPGYDTRPSMRSRRKSPRQMAWELLRSSII